MIGKAAAACQLWGAAKSSEIPSSGRTQFSAAVGGHREKASLVGGKFEVQGMGDWMKVIVCTAFIPPSFLVPRTFRPVNMSSPPRSHAQCWPQGRHSYVSSRKVPQRRPEVPLTTQFSNLVPVSPMAPSSSRVGTAGVIVNPTA